LWTLAQTVEEVEVVLLKAMQQTSIYLSQVQANDIKFDYDVFRMA